MTTAKYLFLILKLTLIVLLSSCKKDPPIDDGNNGKLRIEFLHHYNGEPVIFDSLIYTNEAGNELMINEIQYFISDLTLKSAQGNKVIKEKNGIYYIDIDIPSTLGWNINEKIPANTYNGLSFVFGIPGNKNIPFSFVNSPERDMFWPFYLGGPNGGYHYLKLNGKYLRTSDNLEVPFNFHLGVGQIYSGGVIHVDSITGFVQNYFTIDLSPANFRVEKNKTTTISIVMNIEEWFRNPNTIDFNIFGTSIMQNQAAMNIACENGHNVFTIKEIKIQ